MALRSFHKCFVSALLAVAVNTCLTYGDTNNLHGIGSSWSCKPAQISVPNSGLFPQSHPCACGTPARACGLLTCPLKMWQLGDAVGLGA